MGLMPPIPLSAERKSLSPLPSHQTRTAIQQIWQSVKVQAPGPGLSFRHGHGSTTRIGHSPVPRTHLPHNQRPQPPPQRKRVHLSKPGHSNLPPASGTSRTTQPPPSLPAGVHPEPPPPPAPHGGVCIGCSLHGDLYWLPNEPHTLNPDDFEEWDYTRALALGQSSPPKTIWLYLERSAGALGYRSAATLFFPSGLRWVLCQTSPHQSSEGSPFWAAIMFLRWALESYSHLAFAILGDNLHVVSVLSPSSPPDLPSRSAAGTLGSSLQSIQDSLRPGMIQGWAWLEGHAGLRGIEISDAYSKWAAQTMVWDPSLLGPHPLGCISWAPLRIIHKLTTNSIKQVLPLHTHENIHVESSFRFYNQSSWFKGFPFKWSTGNFNVTPFAFRNNLRPHQCHASPGLHPMDVMSFVSHCPSCST